MVLLAIQWKVQVEQNNSQQNENFHLVVVTEIYKISNILYVLPA